MNRPGWFHLLPDAASQGAGRVDALLAALMAVCSGILLLVFLLVVTYCVRYRAGSPADRSHRLGNIRWFEVSWMSALLVLCLGVFGWGSRVYFDIETPPRDARTIYVVGRQWMWKVQHPEGRREIDELHVPAGEPIRLLLATQDVIHSLFLPAFRLKQDAVPGRYTTLWFTATRPGTYDLYCAEYCGADHSVMRGSLVVMPPDEFERWLSPGGTPQPPSGTMAMAGFGAFKALGCDVCHRPDAADRAPRLDGIWERPIRLANGQMVTADESYVRESILDPNAKISAGYPSPSPMPSYQGKVTEEQLSELVEFIRAARHGWPPSDPPHSAPPEGAP